MIEHEWWDPLESLDKGDHAVHQRVQRRCLSVAEIIESGTTDGINICIAKITLIVFACDEQQFLNTCQICTNLILPFTVRTHSDMISIAHPGAVSLMMSKAVNINLTHHLIP